MGTNPEPALPAETRGSPGFKPFLVFTASPSSFNFGLFPRTFLGSNCSFTKAQSIAGVRIGRGVWYLVIGQPEEVCAVCLLGPPPLPCCHPTFAAGPRSPADSCAAVSASSLGMLWSCLVSELAVHQNAGRASGCWEAAHAA